MIFSFFGLGGGGREREKKKNPEDKKDSTKLKQKLEKLGSKMQALAGG